MPIVDARYYRTLVVCPNKAMAAELVPIVAHGLPLAPVQSIQEYPTRRPLLDLLKTLDPKLCFVDFTSDSERAFTFIAEMRSMGSDTPVVALLGGNNPDMILRCLRQGATDFLIRPFSTDQIDAAVEKIARLYPAPTTKTGIGGKVIALFPAKGACGATTIASNLAFQSKRLGAKKILLADLDPLTGTISFLLKLKSAYSFFDVLSRHHMLDADLWRQMVLVHQGIDILLSPENLMDGIDELHDAAPIFDYAQQNYEIVIADCSNAFTEWNLSIARNADELLLTTTNELGSLQAAQKVLAYFEQNRIDTSKVKVIVNRYDREIGLNSDVISSALQCDVFQVIPSDYETVQKSLMDGKPIPAGSAIGKNMAALADKVCGKRDRGGDDDKKSSFSAFKSIFSKTS